MSEPWAAAVPLADPDTAPFWDSVSEGRLVAQRCRDCGTLRFPPSSLCPSCHVVETEWVQLPTSGTVHSWVVVTHPSTPFFTDHTPYVVALVDLAPGVRIPGRVVDARHDLTEGQSVSVTFLVAPTGSAVYGFKVGP